MKKTLIRSVALCAVGGLLLAATPAQASLRDRVGRLERKVKKLQTKTQYLSGDGVLYQGFTWAYMGLNEECIDDDDARFYYDADIDFYFLDCESFQTPRSVDAVTGNPTRTLASPAMEKALLEALQ